MDFGIRGVDLTYALLDGYDAAILLEVVSRGGAPGTLYVIEPEIQAPAGPDQLASAAMIEELVRDLGRACRHA